MPLINGQTSTRGELPGLSSYRWGSLQRRQRKTKLRLQRQDRREHPRCLQCLLLRNSNRIRPEHANRTYVERNEAEESACSFEVLQAVWHLALSLSSATTLAVLDGPFGIPVER